MRSHMPSSSAAAASTSLLPSSDTTETASATTTTTMRGARQQHYAVSLSANLSYIQTLAVLLLGVLLLACTVCAERDFNFNDSQVPLLEPKDEPAYKQDPYITELTHCQQADSELLLSLVLSKHDWSVLSEIKRAKVLNKFAKFFAIPKEFIVMDTVSKHELNEMQKAAMQRGAHKQNDGAQQRLGRISFVLGCGDKLFSMSEPIVKQIGHQVKDGSIDNITGEKFGWWLIWRKQMKSRARRQAEGSGDEDEDYEYEDSYDEAEPVTEQPTVPTHAHRHHHGVEEDGVNGTLDTNDLSDVNRATLLNTSTSADTTTTSTTSTTQAQTSTTTTTLVPAIETTSSGYPSTDYVEPRVENTTPMIKTRLQKLAVTSGKAFRFAVPDETFYDAEDLTNLRLELTDKDGHELKANSWLQFNAETRELYGLPLDDTVSRWQYRLTATDSGNESVTETVEISVQQHRGVRTVNHEINIAVKINEKSVHKIDWQLKLINAIAETLGDVTNNAIVVREIRQTLQDPNSATLVYFNETLPTSVCPENELNTIVRRFDAIHLSNLVQPTLGIKSITGQLIGSCLKLDQTKTKPTTHVSKNLNPVPRNQIDRVNATVGCLLVYKVPADTFYDPNGDELTLTLRTKDNRELSALNWLQFDSKNREFYGVPKGGDIGSEEYLLVAEDEGGLTGIDALVVVVNPLLPKKEFSAFFKAFLAIRYGNFNANLQRKFVEGIAKLHGDPDTNQIQVRSITTSHDSDNTIVNFYNTSLHKTAHNGCPTNEIAATRNVYLINNNTLRDRVKKELAELNITNLSVMPYGSCYQHTDNRQHEFVPTKTEEPSLKSAFPEEYLITYILPAVIIIVMILIASLIACCLHRRRHKSGKMELGDEEERKSFRAKAPVIFQDELDEKPEIGNKSPIILKDEKPPLLPPSYNTLNANGENDVDEYVPPPAVVIGGREVRGKSPATPSYRKPPPYVSP